MCFPQSEEPLNIDNTVGDRWNSCDEVRKGECNETTIYTFCSEWLYPSDIYCHSTVFILLRNDCYQIASTTPFGGSEVWTCDKIPLLNPSLPLALCVRACVCVSHGICSCSPSSPSSTSLVGSSGLSEPNRADLIFPNKPGFCCCRRSLDTEP